MGVYSPDWETKCPEQTFTEAGLQANFPGSTEAPFTVLDVRIQTLCPPRGARALATWYFGWTLLICYNCLALWTNSSWSIRVLCIPTRDQQQRRIPLILDDFHFQLILLSFCRSHPRLSRRLQPRKESPDTPGKPGFYRPRRRMSRLHGKCIRTGWIPRSGGRDQWICASQRCL